MAEAGNMELDIMDAGELGMLSLRQKGALDRIDYKGWKLTNPEDMDHRRDDMVADIYFSTVLGYNTQVFPGGKHPKSWAEFWDLKKFPGPRTLTDLAAGAVDLEFALLADGVPKDKLYPIDMDRAFKSLDRVRPAIRKFWDTGALSAQMLADKEVVLGSIWNGRLQAIADKGAPVAIEWNEAALQVQFWGVLKGAKNGDNAQRFVDFACQPQIQAAHAGHIPYGPTNREAFKHIKPELAMRLPSSPEHKSEAFLHNAQWWADNRSRVSERWSQWLLQKG
jgi:putative spermidine/putrescine transport system substrate-binding protein